MSQIRKKLRKGNGELILFSVISVVIMTIVVILVAFLQFSVSVNQVTKAVGVTARSVAIAKTFDNAETQWSSVKI